jgi:hypothetical protein
MLPLRLLSATYQSTASPQVWRKLLPARFSKLAAPNLPTAKQPAGKLLSRSLDLRKEGLEKIWAPEGARKQSKPLSDRPRKRRLPGSKESKTNSRALRVGTMDARHERQQGRRPLANPDGPGQSGTPPLERRPDASDCLNRQARHWPERTLRTLRRWQHLERVLSPPRHEASRRALTLADCLAGCRARALVAGFFL